MMRSVTSSLAAALLLSVAAHAAHATAAPETPVAGVRSDAAPLMLAQATTQPPQDPNAAKAPPKKAPPPPAAKAPPPPPKAAAPAPKAAPPAAKIPVPKAPPPAARTAPPPAAPKVTAPPPAPKVVAPPPAPKVMAPPPAPKVMAPPQAPKVMAPPQAPKAVAPPPTSKLAPSSGAPSAPAPTKLAPSGGFAPTAPMQRPAGAGPGGVPPAPPVVTTTMPPPKPAAPVGEAPKTAPATIAPVAPSAVPVAPSGAAPAGAAPAGAAPAGIAPRAAAPGTVAPVAAPVALQELQQKRVQRVENGGKTTVIQEDNRTIIKQDNRVFIQQDPNARFRNGATDFRSQQRPDGLTESIVSRPGGVQIINVTNNNGQLVRRYRREEGGREVTLVDNRGFWSKHGGAVAAGVGIGILATAAVVALAPPAVAIPRHQYIVDYDRASRDDIYDALSAPPIERLERGYSLEEIRYSHSLRDRMRRVDLDTINFDSGSWHVDSDQYGKLEHIAYAMRRVIERDPREVFMIEGHTDAVGNDIDNATLSDRRAEAVANILSSRYDIPPENLVTQGYGEQYLKVQIQGSERANRRVAVRRITPLLARD